MFYCLGPDQRREDDDAYMAAISAEIAQVEAAISELGNRERVGIGGTGSNSLEAATFVVALATLLHELGALRLLAQKLRSIATVLRSTQYTVWRLSKEALIIECCDQVRAIQLDDYDVELQAIQVTTIVKREYDESPVPAGSHLVVIPSRKHDKTYVFLGDDLGGAELMCIVDGLVSGMKGQFSLQPKHRVDRSPLLRSLSHSKCVRNA